MNIFYIFFIYQFFIYIIDNLHIRFSRYLPLKNERSNLTLEEFINYRIENIYKTEVSIGEPPQDIPGFLRTDENGFYISNKSCPERKSFNITKSKTFFYETNKKRFKESLYFFTSFYSTNYYKQIYNYTFSININIQEPFCLNFGTQLLYKISGNDQDLITVLHKTKYIESYYYYYKIYSEDEVYLVLDLNITEKESINYKFVRPLTQSLYYYSWQKWGLNFEYFNFEDRNIQIITGVKAVFDINLGCIISPPYFKESFEKYLDKNNIKFKPMGNKFYDIYFFDKHMKDIEKIKNIELKFYSKELNFNFTFIFNELILEKDNGYYLLIITDSMNQFFWKFGFPFFKKYKFIFNQDSKIIGFQNYNQDPHNIEYNETIINKTIINSDENKKNGKKEEKYNNTYNKSISKIISIIFLSVIFLVILALFLGVFIGRKIFGIRKKKVNELLELYDYSSKDKNTNV